jgi:hypothetical protein
VSVAAMREYLSGIHFFFGESPEERAASMQYVGVARTQLGILKNLMQLGASVAHTRVVVLPDGATIRCSSIAGNDIVRITPPVTATESAGAAQQGLSETQPTSPGARWFVAGYQVIATFSKPTLWTSAGATLLPDGGFGADGEATSIITKSGVLVAVVGWLHNGSYDEVVWWKQVSGAWVLHRSGITWNFFDPMGRVFSGSALVWDFAAGVPVIPSLPSIPIRNPYPHTVRVAVQEWQQFSSPGYGALTIPAMAVFEINDGATVSTVGVWGGPPNNVYYRDDLTLDEWMSFIASQSPDIANYPTPTPPTVTYATIYGPFSASTGLAGTTYNLSYSSAFAYQTQLVFSWDGSTDRMTVAIHGMYNTPSSTLQLTVPLQTISSTVALSWVSIDGKWVAGWEPEGYYYNSGFFSGFAFGADQRPMRYSVSTGVQWMELPAGIPNPNAASPWIGSNGAVLDDVGTQGGTTLAQVRWTPTLFTIHPVGELYTDGVSYGGTATCGGTNDTGRPWAWTENGGVKFLPLPAGCTFGEGNHVTDDGTTIGDVNDGSTSWVVLWFKGQVVLQLNSSNLWFNDVATVG